MFGKLIYKYNEKEHLYLCSSSDLKGVEMWRYNRPHDQARVDEIKGYIDKSGVVDGIIYLAEIEQGWCIKYVCYDGNHRRLTLKEMGETKVLVHLLLNADDEMIKEKFVALNQANPVPELYMIEGDEEMLEKVKEKVKSLGLKYTSAKSVIPSLVDDQEWINMKDADSKLKKLKKINVGLYPTFNRKIFLKSESFFKI